MSKVVNLCETCDAAHPKSVSFKIAFQHRCVNRDRCECEFTHYNKLEPKHAPGPVKKHPVLRIDYGNTIRGIVTLREGDTFNVKAEIKGIEVGWE